jgi:hypothetical protein
MATNEHHQYTPHQIDMFRCRELIAHVANGREPNWRTMGTKEGAMLQDYIRTMWERHRMLLGDFEVMRCAAVEASKHMGVRDLWQWQEKYNEVLG